ncbi:hypothetical protein CR513_43906, partial [Mucuna pruriens]
MAGGKVGKVHRNFSMVLGRVDKDTWMCGDKNYFQTRKKCKNDIVGSIEGIIAALKINKPFN